MSEVTINIEGGAKVAEALKNTESDLAKAMRRAMDEMTMTSIYGKSARGSAGLTAGYRPLILEWASPLSLRGQSFGQSFGRAVRPEPVIPAFVEPERPAAPVEPTPEPDTPAVALLRKLLNDRKAVVEGFEDDIEDSLEDIADLEKLLAEARAELEHEKTCAAQAQAEVDQITADIVKLGGVVEADEPVEG